MQACEGEVLNWQLKRKMARHKKESEKEPVFKYFYKPFF